MALDLDIATLDEIEQLRSHFTLLNGSPEAISVLLDPAVTPSSFATWLSGSGKLALFEQLMAAPAAVGAVAANATAMAAVAASSTAMAAVAASSTAMEAVAASSTAMEAVAASSTALMQIHASDTALNAIKASATAIAAMRGSARYLLSANQVYSGSGVTIGGTTSGASYIVVGISSSNWVAGAALSVDTRRSGSSIANTGLNPGKQSSDGKAIDLAIPIVGPFTGKDAGGYSYAIGLVRCDV